MNWDRRIQQVLAELDDDKGAFLHRLLVELGGSPIGRQAVERALEEHRGAQE